MTVHLEWHQHALIDDTNTVISVAVFEEWAHNHTLIEDVRVANNAKAIICCCQYGLANIGDVWDETSKTWIRPQTAAEEDLVVE